MASMTKAEMKAQFQRSPGPKQRAP